jgi:hypothetical protein
VSKSLGLFLILSVFGSTAIAAEDRSVLAERLVALLRVEDQIAEYQEHCVAAQQSIPPEALASRDPSYFAGLHPGDSKWPEVVSAWDEYIREACSRPTKSEYLQAISSSYARTLTAEQLEDAISFYSSATGAALISASRQTAIASYDIRTAANARYVPDLLIKFQRKIAQLAASE